MTETMPNEYHHRESKRIVIREVWAQNAASEFQLIGSLLVHYPYVSMDTEYPGVVYKPHTPHYCNNSTPKDHLYRFLKANVDELHLIQVGLTLSDAFGNLPDMGGNDKFIWQINLSDFDVEHHLHAPESIKLLKQNGVDFERNKREGVDSVQFGCLMIQSGLVFNSMVTWITFHGAYDFGYLIKLLTRSKLPNNLADFLTIVRGYFGYNVYDVKHMMSYCKDLYGGLSRVAKVLDVDRVVGNDHQAGSDSLLTWLAFQKIVEGYFVNVSPVNFAGVLYGLEITRDSN